MADIKHISEDTLELYVLHNLREPRLAEVEEHLLLCAECRDRIRELDTFRAALQAAVEPEARPIRVVV